MSGLPYLCQWIVSTFGSILVDSLIEKRILSTSLIRKLANTIATMGPGLALLGCLSFLFGTCRTTDLDHSKKNKKTELKAYLSRQSSMCQRVKVFKGQLFNLRLNKNFRGHPVEQIQTRLDLSNTYWLSQEPPLLALTRPSPSPC